MLVKSFCLHSLEEAQKSRNNHTCKVMKLIDQVIIFMPAEYKGCGCLS